MRQGVDASNQGIRTVEDKLEALEASMGAKLARLERLLLRSLGEGGAGSPSVTGGMESSMGSVGSSASSGKGAADGVRIDPLVRSTVDRSIVDRPTPGGAVRRGRTDGGM